MRTFLYNRIHILAQMKESSMYELIEDYLVGNLRGNHLTRFESAMMQDTKLAAEVAIQKDILNALQPKPEDALLKNLQKLNQLYKRERPSCKSDND